MSPQTEADFRVLSLAINSLSSDQQQQQQQQQLEKHSLFPNFGYLYPDGPSSAAAAAFPAAAAAAVAAAASVAAAEFCAGFLFAAAAAAGTDRIRKAWNDPTLRAALEPYPVGVSFQQQQQQQPQQ